LWDQRGSEVIRGDLLVIPIEQSMLYVQPLYLRAEGGRIPELKRVIVAYQNQVVMQDNLDAALATLFGQGSAARRDTSAAGPPPGPAPSGADQQRALIAEAQRHYQAALAAQREGDWARYGNEIRQLGEILARLGSGRP
jgi:uncharacterized membrane protein (UPF0182 family)